MKIWGKNAVLEAIKSGKNIEKVYLQYGKFFDPAFLKLLQNNNIHFQWCKRNELSKKAGTEKHQGIVAVISPVTISNPDKLIHDCIRKKSFFVLPDGVTETQNLGLIARSVEIFGGIGLLIPSKGSAPINETTLKASSGAFFHLVISRSNNIQKDLENFKLLGGKIYTLETGGKDIRKISFEKPLCLIVGSEGRGVSRELLEISDSVVSIPTTGKVKSLNVSVATGIALWEIQKHSLTLG